MRKVCRYIKEMSDTELVEAVIRGDKDAVVYLFYEKFAAMFQYHIYKIFPYKVDVEELTDEFFLYLYEDKWRRLRTYNGSVKLSTWMSVVSFRFFKNYKISRIDCKGLITISDKWESFRGDWIQGVDVEAAVDIRAAIDSIKNDRDRKIAEKLFIKDKSFEDIAAEFGMTVDYVYTVKNRIVKLLKNKLNGYQ